VTDGVREIITKTCPTCDGEGVVLSEETVGIQVQRKLRELVKENPKPEAFLIQVHPRVSAYLLGSPGRPLLELEEALGRHFHFEGSEALPIDHFAVLEEGTRDEIAERALPFREGEEVLVTIDEPHMYNDEDGVAKVDGYRIAVTGAVKHIGQQRLVRIERVGRTAASAVVVGADGAESPVPSPQSTEAQDRPRRRGRRGGRGRGRGGKTKADIVPETDS
jgi:ribonuclease G